MCALLVRFDFIIRILLFALFIVFLCLLKMINELVIVACDKRSSFQHTCIGPFGRVHTESYAIRIFDCSFLRFLVTGGYSQWSNGASFIYRQ